MKPEISVVIPTYNRKDSLFRTLSSIDRQHDLPKEVIIVDSGTDLLAEEDFGSVFSHLTIRYFRSEPSVCKQRNIGIKAAISSYIFLCDDDVEVPEDYLLKLSDYLSENHDTGIATGYFLQKDNKGNWAYEYPVTSFVSLVWSFIFQLAIWGNISSVKTNFFSAPFFKLIQKFYQKRENTYSLAGWPLITDFNNLVVRTTLYSLGAAVIKREWLIASPYDEILIPNGIGDNYGITANLPYHQPIHILTSAYVYHHHSPENRLKSMVSYQYRIFALHYFMLKSHRFNYGNILFLYWSLVGNIIAQSLKLNLRMAQTTIKTLALLLVNRNPYLQKRN